MKIEQVETFLVNRFLVVRITTDDGTQGIGESCYWAYPKAAEETVKTLGEAIIGMDPADTEHIYNYIHRYNGSFRGNSIAAAISSIDIALWDIKGKRLGTPVWDLLGGRARQKVRAIFLGVGGETPDEVAQRAKIALERGYTALKFTPMPRDFQLLKYPLLVDNAIDMLAAVRETVGKEFDIGIEIHRNMRPSEAIVFCEKAMPFNPYFIEDPITPDGVLAMSEVSTKIRLPLAVGERNAHIWEFREYAQMTHCSFFKPDIAVAGGITGVKKISAIAEAHHILIAPHNFQGPVATAACVQLGISSPSWDVLEAVDEDKPPHSDMVDNPMQIVNGYFTITEKPGLGVSFNEDAPNLHPFQSARIPPPIREDGSVGLR